MRILLLSQWFDPEPTFKGLQFAKALRSMGHEVQVLTGFPNYPGGKLYPGFRLRPYTRQRVEGIDVCRVFVFPSHDDSALRRVASYMSFALSASLAVLGLQRPDVVYVYHPPPTAALPALILKAAKRVPFVIDVQDLWPDTLSATGMFDRPELLPVVSAYLAFIYRACAHIVVLSTGFRSALIERGVPAEKLTVIPNWTYEDTSAIPPAAGRKSDGTFQIVYAGNIGKAQGLETLLDAAALLRDSEPRARFLLVGDGLELKALRARAESLDLPNVSFLGRCSTAEAEGLMRAADVLLVHLKDDPLFAITIPSKTQAYLRVGKPILMCARGDAARLVEAAGAGIAVPPGNPIALSAGVQALVAMAAQDRLAMGSAGIAYYDANLALQVGASRFAEVFDRARFAESWSLTFKRLFDIASSLALLLVLSAPMLALSAAIALGMGRPVLFRQERPGRYGTAFKILKFRTMTNATGPFGENLPDRDRLTRLGKFMRSTSLDELPELINVLAGQMSLVGPRPLLTRYTRFFSDEEKLRFMVRPGITGLAQVNGRNQASWTDRFALDVSYVKNRSFPMDLRILLNTFGQAVFRRGVVVDPTSAMLDLDIERADRAL